MSSKRGSSAKTKRESRARSTSRKKRRNPNMGKNLKKPKNKATNKESKKANKVSHEIVQSNSINIHSSNNSLNINEQKKEDSSNIDELIGWKKIAARFKENCDDNEEMDIYQFCAWMAKYRYWLERKLNQNIPLTEREENLLNKEFFGYEISLKPLWVYYFYVFKAIICILCQFGGMLILLGWLYDKYSNRLCANERPKSFKFIAFSFGGYISVTMGSFLASLEIQGLYNIDFDTFHDTPPFIEWSWIFAGRIINQFVLLTAIILSYFVIYVSENPLDIVLNSVALYFMIELDDLMVYQKNYDDVNDWFEECDYNEVEGWQDNEYIIEEFEGTTQKIIIYLRHSLEALLYVALIFSIFGPFWLLFCY